MEFKTGNWNTDSHAKLFEIKAKRFPNFGMEKFYKQYNEILLLEKYVDETDISISDVGCASGEMYYFFKKYYPWLFYTGYDISETAIKKARELYNDGTFYVIDDMVSSIKNTDIVLCSDVVMHQKQPFLFLKKLYDKVDKKLFLRLRTRDVGKTETDFSKSCQYIYDEWYPYIVLNCEELVEHIKNNVVCKKIVLWKFYDILGGKSKRYLPKDLYDIKSGGATTCIYIEFGEGDLIVENTEMSEIAINKFYKFVYKINKSFSKR